MWIRSQDKRILVNTRRVLILAPNTYRKNYEIANYENLRAGNYEGNCEDYDTLGKYKTEERALEVLNQIEGMLTEGCRSDVIVGATRICKESVFEMPEK